MEFLTKYVPVQVKFDVTSPEYNLVLSEDWCERSININPLKTAGRCLQINTYTNECSEIAPCFTLNIDIADIRFGPASSRTKSHVYGLFWTVHGKKCKFFFSFGEKRMHDAYVIYLKGLLKFMEQYQKDNQHMYQNQSQFSLNMSCNDGLVEPLNTTEIVLPFKTIPINAPSEANRDSNPSSIYQKIDPPPNHEQSHPLIRPIAVIADLLKNKRRKVAGNSNSLDQKPDLPSRTPKLAKVNSYDDNAKEPLITKMLIENVFNNETKGEQPLVTEEQISERYQLTLNVDRKSSMDDGINLDMDSDWSEINEEELNSIKMEESIKSIQLKKNRGYIGKSQLSTSESQNLSFLCTSDASQLNLQQTANMTKEQIQSGINVEKAVGKQSQRFSLTSNDSLGYVIMRPILPAYSDFHDHQVDEVTKNINFQRNYDSFASSSGVSSDFDNSTKKSRSIDEAISLTSNDRTLTISMPKGHNKLLPEELTELKLKKLCENQQKKYSIEKWLAGVSDVMNDFDDKIDELEIIDGTKNICEAPLPKLEISNGIKMYDDSKVKDLRYNNSKREKAHTAEKLRQPFPLKKIRANNLVEISYDIPQKIICFHDAISGQNGCQCRGAEKVKSTDELSRKMKIDDAIKNINFEESKQNQSKGRWPLKYLAENPYDVPKKILCFHDTNSRQNGCQCFRDEKTKTANELPSRRKMNDAIATDLTNNAAAGEQELSTEQSPLNSNFASNSIENPYDVPRKILCVHDTNSKQNDCQCRAKDSANQSEESPKERKIDEVTESNANNPEKSEQEQSSHPSPLKRVHFDLSENSYTTYHNDDEPAKINKENNSVHNSFSNENGCRAATETANIIKQSEQNQQFNQLQLDSNIYCNDVTTNAADVSQKKPSFLKRMLRRCRIFRKKPRKNCFVSTAV